MKFCTVKLGGRVIWGFVAGDEVVDLTQLYPDMRSAITAGSLSELAGRAAGAPHVKLVNATFLPVIPNPDKVLCIGLNYETHRKEAGRAEVEHPTIFIRFASSHIGHDQAIIRPRVSTELDFEGELAVIIGKSGRYIPSASAYDYVAGYACYNDGTLRDWQHHTTQFTPGKNFPETGGFGPWLVTPDELGEIGAQRLRTRLNGEVMQDVSLDQMIFNIPRLIEYCSSFTQLEPGDVIATGTPGGVGFKRVPPVWLKPGDEVVVEIEGVGLLRNSIADEARL